MQPLLAGRVTLDFASNVAVTKRVPKEAMRIDLWMVAAVTV